MLEKLKNKLNQLAEKAKESKLTEEERNIRYDICKKCEWLFIPTNTCKKCGCFMTVKTYMPEQSCPIGKWKSISLNNEKSQEK